MTKYGILPPGLTGVENILRWDSRLVKAPVLLFDTAQDAEEYLKHRGLALEYYKITEVSVNLV